MTQFVIIAIVAIILLLSSWKPEAILFGIVILSIVAFIFNKTIFLGIIAVILIVGISILVFRKDAIKIIKPSKEEIEERKQNTEEQQITQSNIQTKPKEKQKMTYKQVTEKMLKTLVNNQYALSNYISYYQNLSQVNGSLVKIDTLFYGFFKSCYINLTNESIAEDKKILSKNGFQKVLNQNRILTEIPNTNIYEKFFNSLLKINDNSKGELYIKEYKNYIKAYKIDTSEEIREDIAFLTIMFFDTMSLAKQTYKDGKNEYMNKKQYFISLEEYQYANANIGDKEYTVYYDIDSYRFNNINELEKLEYLIDADEQVRRIRDQKIKSIFTLGTYSLRQIIERMLNSIEMCNDINQIHAMELVLKHVKYIEEKAKENKVSIQNEYLQKEKIQKAKEEKTNKKAKKDNYKKILLDKILTNPSIVCLYNNIVQTNKDIIQPELDKFSEKYNKNKIAFNEALLDFTINIIKDEENKKDFTEIVSEVKSFSFLKKEKDINLIYAFENEKFSQKEDICNYIYEFNIGKSNNKYLKSYKKIKNNIKFLSLIYYLAKVIAYNIKQLDYIEEFDNNIELNKMYQNLQNITKDTEYITNTLYPIYQKFYTEGFKKELSLCEFGNIIALKNQKEIEIIDGSNIKTQKGLIKYIEKNISKASKDNEREIIAVICNLLISCNMKDERKYSIITNIDQIIKEIKQGV